MDWSWAAILKLASTTGFFTAVLNQAFRFFREMLQQAGKDRRAGKLLAQKIVEILTNYAQECHHRLSANLYDQADGGGYGVYSDMPQLPDYPEGDAWAVLPTKVAAGLRDFRSELKESKRAIEITDEVYGPPEAFDTASHNYIIMGYTAIKLADSLRSRYGLGLYQSTDNDGFVNALRKHYQKSRRGLLHKLWESLPVKRARRWVSRKRKSVIHLFTYTKM